MVSISLFYAKLIDFYSLLTIAPFVSNKNARYTLRVLYYSVAFRKKRDKLPKNRDRLWQCFAKFDIQHSTFDITHFVSHKKSGQIVRYLPACHLRASKQQARLRYIRKVI